jgi:predicted nucleic acid-binding protein
MNYSPISSVVVDANFAVRAVLPPGTGKEMALFTQWQMSQNQAFAPDIWHAEVTSAVRQMLFRKEIQPFVGEILIKNLFALNIQIVMSDMNLCREALVWADRLGQAKAYDGFYLALAHRMKSDLWTVDECLANRARQIGASWVHWVGEASF